MVSMIFRAKKKIATPCSCAVISMHHLNIWRKLRLCGGGRLCIILDDRTRDFAVLHIILVALIFLSQFLVLYKLHGVAEYKNCISSFFGEKKKKKMFEYTICAVTHQQSVIKFVHYYISFDGRKKERHNRQRGLTYSASGIPEGNG